METREIPKEKYRDSKKLNKGELGRGEYLSFSDIEKLMRHRSYKRIKGRSYHDKR
ncbi:hypothetical protein ACJDU8_19725 [Clostridium sp. WILCCON 0269]|uniref:Uncharacterized protein n=1 Tax=Candidatus Clostridium eludens TaxID=3381663 RepID=A0ABW8SR39_9CLOT